MVGDFNCVLTMQPWFHKKDLSEYLFEFLFLFCLFCFHLVFCMFYFIMFYLFFFIYSFLYLFVCSSVTFLWLCVCFFYLFKLFSYKKNLPTKFSHKKYLYCRKSYERGDKKFGHSWFRNQRWWKHSPIPKKNYW